MLQDGRIDLLSDVSYTEERAEYMLYSHIPMGSELYYLYVFPENTTISIEDPTTLNIHSAIRCARQSSSGIHTHSRISARRCPFC